MGDRRIGVITEGGEALLVAPDCDDSLGADRSCRLQRHPTDGAGRAEHDDDVVAPSARPRCVTESHPANPAVPNAAPTAASVPPGMSITHDAGTRPARRRSRRGQSRCPPPKP